MVKAELAALLRAMYDGAKRNETACQVHVCGIKYARELHECGCPLKESVQRSGISMGYLSEVSKGVELAQYV